MVVPGQRLSEPLAVTVGAAGLLDSVTVTGAEVLLHEPEVTVTVKVPDAVTLIDCVVAPFDHRLPVELLELSVTFPPGQNETGPLAVMVGVEIEVDTVTVMDDEVAVVPFLVTFTA